MIGRYLFNKTLVRGSIRRQTTLIFGEDIEDPKVGVFG